jgi:DNA-binding transcriptional LysR family regulator
MMNHAQLKAFHAVAKTGGFTSAARTLGITQPAVTLQVQALERQYNTILFVRKGRHVELTQSGRLLQQLSDRYFSLEQEAHGLLTSIMQLKSGKLRLASDLAPRVFPLTAHFKKAYPDIELSVSICRRREIEEMLVDHLVEIALTGYKPDDPALEWRLIREEPVTVTVPDQHPLHSYDPLVLEDLTDQTLLLHADTEDGLGREETEILRLGQFQKSRIVLMENRELVREAVAYGEGISFLSKREVLRDRRLLALPLQECPLNRCEYVVYHKLKRDTPLVSAFVALAVPG